MNGWRRGHRSHTLALCGRSFVCYMTYLPFSPQGTPRFEFFAAVTYSSQSNSKLYIQKNYSVLTPPPRRTFPVINFRKFFVRWSAVLLPTHLRLNRRNFARVTFSNFSIHLFYADSDSKSIFALCSNLYKPVLVEITAWCRLGCTNDVLVCWCI